jgi:hypothetical protein
MPRRFQRKITIGSQQQCNLSRYRGAAIGDLQSDSPTGDSQP